MLVRKNELGWRLYKSRHDFTIQQPHVLLRRRIHQVEPVLLNLLLAAVVWLMGRDPSKVKIVLQTIPFTLLMGLYCFRPGILYLRTRRRIAGDVAGSMPFSWLHIELGQDEETGLHRVFLKGGGDFDETTTGRHWNRLVWESDTETETAAVAEELRAVGIGTPDPVILAVRGDRRLRLLACGGYSLAVTALIVLLTRMGWRDEKGFEDTEPATLLHAAQVILAFLFLSLLPFATYLVRLGQGAIRHGLLPPPGMRIVSDMRLIEGEHAVIRGRRTAVLGWVLLIVGLVGGLYVPYKIGRLYGQSLRSVTPQASTHK